MKMKMELKLQGFTKVFFFQENVHNPGRYRKVVLLKY